MVPGFAFARQPHDRKWHIIGQHEDEPPAQMALCGVARMVLSGDQPTVDGQEVCSKCLALAPRAKADLQAFGHAGHEPRAS